MAAHGVRSLSLDNMKSLISASHGMESQPVQDSPFPRNVARPEYLASNGSLQCFVKPLTCMSIVLAVRMNSEECHSVNQPLSGGGFACPITAEHKYPINNDDIAPYQRPPSDAWW